MKTLFSILLVAGITATINFRKKVLSYPEIITQSNLIVVGEISDTSFFFDEYDFKISEYLKGKSEIEITINMWEEWLCDKRMMKPKKGQKLLLFLKKKDGEYEAVNGSTGELFITEKDSLQTYMRKNFHNCSEFKEAIKMFTTSLKYDGKKYYTKLFEEKKIDEMRKSNHIFDWWIDFIKIKK